MSDKAREYEKKVITPHLLINTPFAEYCDGNRLQIAASQARQALPLELAEPAYVITGYEKDQCLTERTLAKDNGEVKFVSNKAIVIYYKDLDEYDVISVWPDDEVYVQEGQYILKGDLIKAKEYYFTSDGELTQGVNLVCAVISHPLGFEDAFVISKSGAKKLIAFKYEKEEIELTKNDILLSRTEKGYNPLPEENQKLIKGDKLYVKSKLNVLDQLRAKPILLDKETLVKQIFIAINDKFDTEFREYYLNLKYRIDTVRERILATDLPEYIKKRLINIHMVFDSNKNSIEGFSRENVFIRINMRKKLKLSKGDKLTNRHAAKGVLGMKVGDKHMPVLSDGRVAEIILNPMAIPSRMNASQLYELAANRALYNFKQRLQEYVEEGKTIDELYEFIYKFYEMMSEKAPWIIEGIKESLEKLRDMIEPEDLLEIDWRFIAPAFESVSAETLQEMLLFVSKPLYAIVDFYTQITQENYVYIMDDSVKLTKEVKQRIYEIYGRFIDKEEIDAVLESNPKIVEINPFVDIVWYNGKFILASADYMYFYRLVHIADEKMSARSISTYDMMGQPAPLPNEKGKTPHRFGEMEVWDLIAYDALRILDEFLNVKSDNHYRKLEYIYEVLTGQEIALSRGGILDNEIIKALKVHLTQLGIDIKEISYYNIDYYKEGKHNE